MSAVESRLAATLAKHVYNEWGVDDYYCSCGASTSSNGWPAHVAAVIASSDDLAVISLPVSDESDAGTENENGWREWHTPHGEITVFDDGEIHLNGGTTSADHITRLAAALLAAAKAAEGVTSDEV